MQVDPCANQRAQRRRRRGRRDMAACLLCGLCVFSLRSLRYFFFSPHPLLLKHHLPVEDGHDDSGLFNPDRIDCENVI